LDQLRRTVVSEDGGQDLRWEAYKDLYAQIVARHEVPDDGRASAQGRQDPDLSS